MVETLPQKCHPWQTQWIRSKRIWWNRCVYVSFWLIVLIKNCSMNNHENFISLKLFDSSPSSLFSLSADLWSHVTKKKDLIHAYNWMSIRCLPFTLLKRVNSVTYCENNVPKGIKQCVNPARYIRILLIRIRQESHGSHI
jgi:hypothetical protein